MVLVDTSVWIKHFRDGSTQLSELLQQGTVVCHPFVIGELACGHLQNRQEILTSLERLPTAEVATHTEILAFIEKHQLMGKGLGLIDIHLLASSLLSSIPLWTRDKRLQQAAKELGVHYKA